MRVVYTGRLVEGPQGLRPNGTDFAISDIPYQGVDPTTGRRRHQHGRALRLPADRRRRHGVHLPPQDRRPAGHATCGCPARRSPRSSPTRSPTGTTRRSPRTTRPALPSQPIMPVVRSDGSGATAQFTLWMDKQYPASGGRSTGKAGPDLDLPASGPGRSPRPARRVMNTITGFARRRRDRLRRVLLPAASHYPVVKVLNKAGLLRPAHAVQRRGRADQGEDQQGHEQIRAVPDPDPRRRLHATRTRGPTRSRRTAT